MRLTRPTRFAAMLVASAFLIAPGGALADGDPASDILLTGDTFFPYQPKVSANVAAALNGTVAHAKAAGFPIKVAIVAAATDLGAVPDLFGKPQKYADFLDKEISYNKKAMLLVVMPQGFGVAPAAPPGLLAGTTIPHGSAADGLGRAAIAAVGVLAAQAGHRIAVAPIASSSSSSASGSPALLTFGAPLALVLLVAGGAAVARRRRVHADSQIPDDDDDLDGEPTATPPPEDHR